VNTVFNASLALVSIPDERFFPDFRVLLVFEALFLAVVLLDFFADFFLVVDLELEADLVDFFLVVFLVVIPSLVRRFIHMKQRFPTSEEALPAVDDALAFPPGLLKETSQNCAAPGR
jgi:hypothetical protein